MPAQSGGQTTREATRTTRRKPELPDPQILRPSRPAPPPPDKTEARQPEPRATTLWFRTATATAGPCLSHPFPAGIGEREALPVLPETARCREPRSITPGSGRPLPLDSGKGSRRGGRRSSCPRGLALRSIVGEFF